MLYPAPPIRMEDFFYRPKGNGGKHSAKAQAFFEATMASAEIDTSQETDEAALLSEFQRKGWYAAACCECPLEETGIAPKYVAERFAETVEKRVRLSYKPKRIALASYLLESLRETLESAGFRDAFTLTNCICD